MLQCSEGRELYAKARRYASDFLGLNPGTLRARMRKPGIRTAR